MLQKFYLGLGTSNWAATASCCFSMAYFWLLISSDATAFSFFSLCTTSSLSSSLPGEFELELASEAAADATSARRAAVNLPCGHLAVLGLGPVHAAVGAGACNLRPAHCILLFLLPKLNRIGSPRKQKIMKPKSAALG